jgi:hypothetical protein
MADRMTELGIALVKAIERNDLDAARKIAAEQRRIVEVEYSDRATTTLTADPLPF